MKIMKSLMILAVTVAFLTGGSLLAWAQTAPDAHHPSDGTVVQPGAVAASPGMMDMMQMMQMMQMMGMMNMMGQGGQAMSGMGISGMGISGMGISGMGISGMGISGMGMSGMDMPGMAMIDRIEGRLAFLRAELKITEAQTKAWDAFSQALRDNSKRLGEVRASIQSGMDATQPSLSQRLANQETWLAARLKGVRKINSALNALFDVLSSDQQKTANELLEYHMGLMRRGPIPGMPIEGATP